MLWHEVAAGLPMASTLACVRQAQRQWARQPVRQRLRVMRRLRHLIARDAALLTQAVMGSGTRSQAETLMSEVLPLADACRFLEREAVALLQPRRLALRRRPLWLHGVKASVHREPFGVVFIIAPQNYPLFIPGVQLLQALVAGNAVVLKPGPGGTTAATTLTDMLQQAGLHPHLVHVLPEAPEGAAAVIAAGVDKVIVTGRDTTGRAMLTHLASHLVPATLELSGCDAAFVRADADLDLVAPALLFGLRFNGSATCIAPRRVFVAQSLADALAARLLAGVRDAAPHAVAPAAWARVQTLVAEACQQGARCLAGRFLANETMTPVIMADAEPTMPLLQEDCFAPVLALVRVRDDDEALAAVEHCAYALGATVFGQSGAAQALARRIRAGAVVINDVIVPTADPRLPFGGRGRSGYGVTRGAEGLVALTTIKAIAVRQGRWRPHYDPPRPEDAELFRAYIVAVHGDSWRARLTALVSGVRRLMQRGRQDRPRHGGAS
jgi:acyl-CoA reductase-like NAD-dependent aldehyde dehydrogenase